MMLRKLVAIVLIFMVVFQAGSALACTALVEMQGQSSAAASCCSELKSEPFESPGGMPESQCCFRNGPLLSKALTPEAPEPLQCFDGLLEPAPAYGYAHADTAHELLHASSDLHRPTGQALLQIFRI